MRRTYRARAVSFDILSLVLMLAVGAFLYAILGGITDLFVAEAVSVQTASGSEAHAKGIQTWKTIWENLPTFLVIAGALWGIGMAIVRRST